MRDVTEFSVGDILRTSFTVYFSNLPSFMPLSVIAFAPSFAVLLLVDSSSFNSPFDPAVAMQQGPLSAEYWGLLLVAMREGFVNWLCGIWLQAGLAFGVVRHLRGGRPGFLVTFVQSLRMLLPVLLVAVVVAVATGLGFLLFIVPGIFIALVFWVAMPAAVVEGGGLRALGRSARLTDGYKGQIFGLALILVILQVVAFVPVDLVVNTIGLGDVAYMVLVLLWGIVLGGIWATAVSVAYHDLRVLKDGVDTRAVAKVFD